MRWSSDREPGVELSDRSAEIYLNSVERQALKETRAKSREFNMFDISPQYSIDNYRTLAEEDRLLTQSWFREYEQFRKWVHAVIPRNSWSPPWYVVSMLEEWDHVINIEAGGDWHRMDAMQYERRARTAFLAKLDDAGPDDVISIDYRYFPSLAGCILLRDRTAFFCRMKLNRKGTEVYAFAERRMEVAHRELNRYQEGRYR